MRSNKAEASKSQRDNCVDVGVLRQRVGEKDAEVAEAVNLINGGT